MAKASNKQLARTLLDEHCRSIAAQGGAKAPEAFQGHR